MRMLLASGALALVSILGCKGPGEYVWGDEFKPEPLREQAYALAPGDVIGVRIATDQPVRARIRDDGKVSLPFVNEVTAAGLTPAALTAELQERLKEFIKNPLVTVSLEEQRPRLVYVTGEVMKPGPYSIDTAGGVLQALVNAGGLAQTASTDRIFVLRDIPNRNRVRIRFTYEGLTRLNGPSASFRLQPGDVVVVE